MRRTTIMLPDDVDAMVRLEARHRGLSIADVAREAIEEHLQRATSTGPLGFFAVGEGDPPDVSERVDEFVRAAVSRRRRPQQPA